jgi:peroxiredoxin
MTESVVGLLGELHAERLRTWEPEKLQGNIDQRRINVERYSTANSPKVGDTLAPFELENVEGGIIRSEDLVKSGPVALVFFRHGGCPACNIALPYYARNLAPTLAELGVGLVAVSPQPTDKLRDIQTRQAFDFAVASDPGDKLGRRLGINFRSDGPPSAAAIELGLEELVHPTVVILDTDHVVRFIDVTPNWMARTEAGPVIEAARKVVEARRETVQA